MRNLITDVSGLSVGNAHDEALASGVTVALFDEPAVASVAVHGGAPGVCDTALLEPEASVECVDALVLSGGSAFGLCASSGVLSHLRELGRGFAVGDVRVPIAPGAVIFDLASGGNTNWEGIPPWWDLGYRAAAAAHCDFALGTAGAGYGATTANLKGGLGSASAITSAGFIVGGLVAVNAVGSVLIGEGPHFWAGSEERDLEFGGYGWPTAVDQASLQTPLKGDANPRANTTIAIIATDARLTKAEARRIAIMAHDGVARAVRPSHAPMDGDLVFAAATAKANRSPDLRELADIGFVAASCLARAIARAVYEATALPFAGALPAYRDRFGVNQ
ncbi:MAG: P1 family peptidase [Hyphomicrobium sp.]